MAEGAILAAVKFVGNAAAAININLTAYQAALIVDAAIYAVASVGVNAYLSSQRQMPNQGRALELGIAPDMPRRLQVGRRGNAGVLVDWFVSGNKNQFLWLVKYLHEGPGDPINEIWADGRQVWTGTLNHGQSVRLTEFDSPDERMRVWFYDGRVGQTAPSELTGNGHVGATYRGTGCCYVIEKLHWDPDTTPAPPGMVYVSNGSHFYDRRVGAQDLLDPSTWTSTKNPAVAADHYCLGNYWPGMSRPRLGIGLPASEVPYDRFNSNANIAEELVPLIIGNQARYEANGFLFADQVHADILTELYKAMDARPADFGGLVGAISHASSASIMTITDDDLLEQGNEIYEPKRSWGQLVGGAEGTYQDPANNFQPAPYPAIESSVWETEDGGRTPVKTFDLPFETDPSRAQRLAKLFVQRERRQATLSGIYAPRVLELEEGDWFTRQGARFPSGKVFEVVEPPQLDPNTMTVTMSALEVDPSDSAWTSTDAQDVDTPTGDPNTTPPALPIPTVNFQTFVWSFGSYSFASIRFDHTEFADVPLDIDIEIAVDNGAGAPDTSNNIIDVKIAAGRQYGTYSSLLPGQNYVVRARSRGGTRQSDWSAWVQIVAGVAQYGTIGAGDVRLGVNVYANDGTTLLGDGDLITDQGFSQGFIGEGALARLNNVDWGTLITGRPIELTDGRISAGLDASGDLNRNIPSSRLDSSNVLRRTSGGLFTGDLTATFGADWNVNLANYPGDAAVITAQGFSAGFTGEGPLARSLLTEAGVDNLLAGVGMDAIADPYFQFYGGPQTSLYWGVDGTMPNSVTHAVNYTNDGIAYLRVTATATANGQYRRIRTPFVSGGQHNVRQGISVSPGDRVGAAAKLGIQNGYAAQVWIEFRDSAGGWVGSANASAVSPGTGTGNRDSFTYVEVFGDAPAGAAWAFLAVRFYSNNGQALDGRYLEPQLARLPAGATSMPPFSPRPSVENAATRGAIAGLHIFDDDGTTILSGSTIKTAVGTAAAFTSQGAQSFANFYRQTANPGNQPDGSQWVDLNENVIKYSVGNQWFIGADLNAAGGVSVTPAQVSVEGDGTAQTLVTPAVQIDIGGYSSATYAWSANGTGITIDNPTSANTTFRKAMAAGESDLGNSITCDVTVNTGAVFQVVVQVDLENAAGTVELGSTRTITDFGPNGGTGAAGIRFNTNGGLQKFQSNGGGYSNDSPSTWITPVSSAPGAYQVRATLTSGNSGDLVLNPGLGTWLALTSAREWRVDYSDPDPGNFGLNPGAAVTLTLEIREGTGAVLDSVSVTLDANTS